MRYAFGLRAFGEAFGSEGAINSLTDEPVRVADTLRQVSVWRAMADGTATPNQIAAFEAEMPDRSAQTMVDVAELAERILVHRDEPQVVVGPWAMAWRIMEAGRRADIEENALQPDSVVYIAGGMKGLTLPDDYDEQMARFLGPVIRPRLYSMSEQSIIAPMCEAGAYHWPKALELFVLDESGEHLLEADASGTVTGPLGAYDPIWSARWGGIVTGDQVTVHHARCECGRPGPAIADSILRYSELSAAGDDKLTCGGTIEQYIRGIAGE